MILTRQLAILSWICLAALGCSGGPRNAAEGGDRQAQFELGAAYEEGMGGEIQDYAAAVKWYKRAAEQGHADAQYRLGLLVADGLGTEPNPAEAAHWFLESARQEHPDAQFQLGVLYDSGEGVDQDHVEAARLFHLAAEHGNSDAQYNLGLMYSAGQGVPRDEAEASRWFRSAAEQDDIDAMFQLGVSYADGLGLQQNLVQAYLWLNRAANRDHERALVERDLLTTRMTEKRSPRESVFPGTGNHPDRSDVLEARVSTKLSLAIHFIDGTRMTCEFPRQSEDPMRVLRNVRRALESDKIALELEGQLLLVPSSNVKYLSVSPTPDPLPDGVIRGAVLKD